MRKSAVLHIRALNPLILAKFAKETSTGALLLCLGMGITAVSRFAGVRVLDTFLEFFFAEVNKAVIRATVAFYFIFMLIGVALIMVLEHELPQGEMSLLDLVSRHPELLSSGGVVRADVVFDFPKEKPWFALIALLFFSMSLLFAPPIALDPTQWLALAVVLSPALLFFGALVLYDLVAPKNATQLIVSDGRLIIRCGRLWCISVDLDKISELQVVRIISFCSSDYGSTRGWGLRLVLGELKARVVNVDKLSDRIPQTLERFVRVTGAIVGFMGWSKYEDIRHFENWREVYQLE